MLNHAIILGRRPSYRYIQYHNCLNLIAGTMPNAGNHWEDFCINGLLGPHTSRVYVTSWQLSSARVNCVNNLFRHAQWIAINTRNIFADKSGYVWIFPMAPVLIQGRTVSDGHYSVQFINDKIKNRKNRFFYTFFPIFIHEINYWKLWNNTLIIQIKNIFIKTSSQVLERRNMTYTLYMYNTKWRKRNITTTKK